MTVQEPFEAYLVEAIYPEAERLGYGVLLSASTPGRDSVRSADADGMRRTVGHLTGLGHRRIVHVDGRPQRHLEDPGVAPRGVVLPPSLVVRGTTAAPRTVS
jgi:hypothetical protein